MAADIFIYIYIYKYKYIYMHEASTSLGSCVKTTPRQDQDNNGRVNQCAVTAVSGALGTQHEVGLHRALRVHKNSSPNSKNHQRRRCKQ
jgi:hypothetical protein